MQRRNDAIFRALPFVMALLLLPLAPMQSASALFSRAKASCIPLSHASPKPCLWNL